MRRPLWAIALVLFWALLVGMGKAPGPEVPMPEIDYKATIKDDQEIGTKVSHASWEGNTYFLGTRGKGTVTIAFEKVRKLTATGTGSETQIDFQVTLRNGDVVAVSFDNDARFYGTTNFGSYRILAKNIKEIVFE